VTQTKIPLKKNNGYDDVHEWTERNKNAKTTKPQELKGVTTGVGEK